MVLEEFPEVLDDQLGRPGILVFLEPLVDADDVHELVGQVVLGPLPVLKDDGRAHGDRRDREHGQDRPLRTGDRRVYAQRDKVAVRDLFQPRTDISRGKFVLDFFTVLDQHFRECRRFFKIDLELLFTAVGADPLLFHVFFRDLVAGLVIISTYDLFNLIRGQQDPPAGPARDTEQFPYQARVPDMDDGFCKFDVAEVSGALACLLVAGLAPEPRVNNPEVEVHEPLRVGETVVIIGVRPDNFPHAHLADLFGGE